MLRCGQLLVVAGASGAGKTTLIDGWRRGQHAALRRHVGIGSIQDWQFLQVQDCRRSAIQTERAVLHVDLFSDWRKDRAFGRLHDILNAAGRTNVVTLSASTAELRRRIAARRRDDWRLLLRRPFCRQSWRFAFRQERRMKPRAYREKATLPSLYADWFAFLERRLDGDHTLLDSTTPQVRLIEPCSLSHALAILAGLSPQSGFAPTAIAPERRAA